MNVRLGCLRTNGPLFYDVVDRVHKTSIYFFNWGENSWLSTLDRDANKSTSKK